MHKQNLYTYTSKCMYVLVNIPMHINIFIHNNINMDMNINMNIYIHMYIHLYVYFFIHKKNNSIHIHMNVRK